MIKQAKNISSIFFYIFFAFLPFQINSLLFSEGIYGSGFFNPYLSHFVYISDIFLLFGLLFLAPWFFVECKLGMKKMFYLLLAFLCAIVISLFFTSNFASSSFYVLRFVEFFLVYLIIVNGFVKVGTLSKIFIFVMFFESVVGIGQYVLQESLGLRFFGEPMISSADGGVAKVGLFDKNVLRIYGTFPHPNIFAGYLITSIFLTLNFVKKSWLFKAILLILVLALLLTFSRTAFMALVLGFIIYMWLYSGKVKYFPVFILISLLFTSLFFLGYGRVFLERLSLSDVAVSQRYFYIDLAFQMFKNHPFGVGVGNFTAVMQNYTDVKILPWIFQPVHNIYLLSLVESGIMGFASLISIFLLSFYSLFMKIKSVKNVITKNMMLSILSVLICFFVIGFFDHYLISLYQGQMLFAMVLGCTGFYLKRA